MQNSKKMIKKILVDILGILCIIGAILTGWLPGPGGIPLFFAGLGLLATNHEWARKLLKYIQINGSKILRKIFPDTKMAKNIYDLVAVILVIFGIIILVSASQRWQQSIAVTMLCISLGIVLVNRSRWQKIGAWFKG